MITKADIRLVRSLADNRARMETGLFVAEGEKLISELLSSHLRIRRLFALEGVFEGGDVETVSAKDMERLSLLTTAGNSLALVEIPHYEFNPRAALRDIVLVLDDVQNPGNMGTLIRLADWFGIGEVVCSPSSASCFNPKVVQATMGAILRVRVHYADIDRLLGEAGNIPVYGTFLEGENIYKANLSPNGFVVMGNEGHGISASVARRVTHKLFIPPYPASRRGSESLNVAMAAGVVCAEFRRRML